MFHNSHGRAALQKMEDKMASVYQPQRAALSKTLPVSIVDVLAACPGFPFFPSHFNWPVTGLGQTCWTLTRRAGGRSARGPSPALTRSS